MVTLFAYWDQLSYGFTDVDVQPLILTGRFGSLQDIWSILTEPLMKGMMVNALYWRPVTSLSYGLDALIWDIDPIGYHLTDLCLHMATGLILFSFVRRLWRELGRPGATEIASVATFLFVLHPVNVENVPAIARRAEILVGLFLIGTLWFLLAGFRRSAVWPGLAAQAGCILGMGSKESGFAIPLVGLVFVVCCHPGCDRASRAQKMTLAAPLLAWGGIVFALRGLVLREMGGAEMATQGPAWWRLPYSVWLHFVGLILPGSSRFFDFPRPDDLVSGVGNLVQEHPIALVTIGVGGLCAAHLGMQKIGWSRSSNRLLVFLLGGMGALFLVYSQVVYDTRYLYPSALFFSALLAWWLWEAIQAVRRPGPILERFPAGLALLGLGLLAISLIVVSPLVSHDGIDEWGDSAAISQQALEQVEDRVAGLSPGSRVFLVNFPYRVDRSLIPGSIMLLEHSVQGWLDLRLPEKNLEVVGLSYLYFEYPIRDLEVDVRMNPDRRLRISVSGQGGATGFPWSTQYGPHYEGSLYEFVGSRQGQNLEIQLLEEVTDPEPVFLVWAGNGVQLERGWNWHARMTGEENAAGL